VTLPRLQRRAPFAILLVLIALAHALLAGWASSTKSPTYDEPVHLLGAYLHWHTGDFRINPEHPALWHNLLAAGTRADRLTLDFASPDFALVPADQNSQWLWFFAEANSPDKLHTNDFPALIQSARWRSAFLFGSVLVLLTGLFLRDLFRARPHGNLLALLGAGAIGLDANFLAHAPLVTNDVAIAAAFVGLLWAGLRVMRRLTWANLIALGLATGVAVCTKYTGVVLGSAIWIALLLRAAGSMSSRWNWETLGRGVTSDAQRLVAVLLVTIAMGAGGWLIVWASYGFRFAAIDPRLATAQFPADHPAAHDRGLLSQFNFDAMRQLNRAFAFNRREGRFPAPDKLPADAQVIASPAYDGAVTACVYAARDAKLLPESYLFGFYYAYVRSKVRGGFVAGEYYVDGRWYYYPLAMLFKTPTATLLLLGAGAVVGVLSLRKRTLSPGEWSAIALLGVPVVIYFASAMTSGLNIGVRHLLVVYPAATALALGALGRRDHYGDTEVTEKGKDIGASSDPSASASALTRCPPCLRGEYYAVAACVLIAIESLAATPDFIPFFNLPSRLFGENGVRLLGDSNFDWGQDLPALAAWQRANPNTRLYLNYFGSIEPAYYGIRYTPWGPNFDVRARDAMQTRLDQPGILAISATNWQGIYAEQLRPAFVNRKSVPVGQVGGSIYLFEYNVQAPATSPAR
jgi:hypothetical protein